MDSAIHGEIRGSVLPRRGPSPFETSAGDTANHRQLGEMTESLQQPQQRCMPRGPLPQSSRPEYSLASVSPNLQQSAGNLSTPIKYGSRLFFPSLPVPRLPAPHVRLAAPPGRQGYRYLCSSCHKMERSKHTIAGRHSLSSSCRVQQLTFTRRTLTCCSQENPVWLRQLRAARLILYLAHQKGKAAQRFHVVCL